MEENYDLLKIFNYIRNNEESFIKKIKQITKFDVLKINLEYDLLKKEDPYNNSLEINLGIKRMFDDGIGFIKIYINEIIPEISEYDMNEKQCNSFIKYINKINND